MSRKNGDVQEILKAIGFRGEESSVEHISVACKSVCHVVMLRSNRKICPLVHIVMLYIRDRCQRLFPINGVIFEY